jgi:phosphate transport system substrate-binding protein
MAGKDVPVRWCGGFSKRCCLTVLVLLAVALNGCAIRDADPSGSSDGAIATRTNKAADSQSTVLRGRITIDGSSTVYPITQAAAEEFMKLHRRVAIPIGVAGTAGGFKRFVVGDLDICDASRPIEPEEIAACRQDAVDYLEMPIGIDGITVVVNAKNTWCDSLTVGQLKRLWESGSLIRTWNDLDPAFPKQEIELYGPDTDSGTFEYFTEVICGRRGNSRTDYTPSSNDNVLIQGVEGDAGALGYFGYAYYTMNRSSLRALKIVPSGETSAGKKSPPGGIAPTDETIVSDQYRPLSRPLFLYVNRKSLKRPEVAAFLTFYLDQAPTFVSEVHYIPLPTARAAECRARLQQALPTQ